MSDVEPGPLTLVVILTARAGALDELREFEARAARVMSRHGGSLERVIAIPPDAVVPTAREVHIVTFPDAAAFASYRDDGELRALAPLRARAVLDTVVLVGTEAAGHGAAR